jgi:erythromycin esterase-like protein
MTAGGEPARLAMAAREAAIPLEGPDGPYGELLETIGEARFVLLGEASHGTSDFYRARAAITKRLIEEKGFAAVAVEADWPDAYRVNRWVRGGGEDGSPDAALGGFERFPTWMWRNADVLDFVAWLRRHNDAVVDEPARAGFYGLDLYSLGLSMRAVLEYLDRVDPEAARRARYRYSCFDHFGEDPQAYGYAAGFGLEESCEQQVVAQLVELRRAAADYARRDGRVAADELFYAEQNARLVQNAERYYRAMFQGRVSSWNLRDRHMAETLQALVRHLDRPGRPARIVVWAHNSHLGDARATEMGEAGELNVGQLVRERCGHDAVLVGFTTHTGTVTAASEWDGPAEKKRVRPALPGSWEAIFHATGVPRFLLPVRGRSDLTAPRLERAIGVIYRPETERASHYFHARLSQQFDAVLHFDETEAVRPLERSAVPQPEPAETYPSGL